MNQLDAKIYSWLSLAEKIKQWQAQGEQVVFTNGCFDLLHFGHLHYLASARKLGQRLVVGLNASSSVQRLKGSHRPIKDEKSRLYLMASLVMVDAVVVFEEDTPFELIKTLEPDVLVKGGDWRPDQIVGADLVLARGGQVKSLQFIDGYSTTALEQKILDQAS